MDIIETIYPAFTANSIAPCGETIGPNKPKSYPAKYWVDDHFPVYNVHTNQQTTE